MTTSSAPQPVAIDQETFLGIDVGNSKTHLAVVDNAGRLLAAAEGPGLLDGYYDPRDLVDMVLELTRTASGRSAGFRSAAFAVAGLDLPVQYEHMTHLLVEAGVAKRVIALNDTFALLRTASAHGDGVAVVAGAGINCVGVRGERHVRYHAMGQISGDWGGGIDVGREALALACRAEDGRGSPTVLQSRVAAHFGVDRPLQVTEAIMLGQLSETRLLELSPIVFIASDEGDEQAGRVLDRLGDEVAALITATATRLGWSHDDGPLPVLLGGSLLQTRNARLVERVREATSELTIRLDIANVPPVVGAALLALDAVHVKVPADATTRLAADFATQITETRRTL